MPSYRLPVTVGLMSLLIAACAGSEQREEQKPPIVEVFACSDYCPGPEKKYLKKVYKGVNDEETCLRLGGRPYVYIGWGSFFVCIAE